MRRSKSTLDIFDLILYTFAFATLISSTYSMVVFESELSQLEPRDTASTPTPTPTDPYSYYTPQQSLYISKINSLVNEYFKLRKATIIIGVLFGLLSLTMCFVTCFRTPKKVPDVAEVRVDDDDSDVEDRVGTSSQDGGRVVNPATYMDGAGTEKGH